MFACVVMYVTLYDILMSTMEYVVLLRLPDVPQDLHAWLAARGGRLRRMYPQATDAEGRRWHLLDPAQPEQAQALLDAWLQRPEVDAAYAKPEGEAPG